MTTDREDLELLPEGVREALNAFGVHERDFPDANRLDHVLRDYCLRLARELAESRETIKRLNRRVQVAEKGIAEKIKEYGGRSLGRALANAAAEMYQAELAALRQKIAESHTGVVWAEADWHGDTGIDPPIPPELRGDRVAVLRLPLDDGGEG